MAIQNLNNLYTPGTPRPARKRTRVNSDAKDNEIKSSTLEERKAETTGSTEQTVVKDRKESMFKELSQASSLPDNEEKIDIEKAMSVDDGKLTDDQMKALLNEEPEKEKDTEGFMSDYLSRFNGSDKKVDSKEKTQGNEPNIYSQIVSGAKSVNPETGQSLVNPDDLVAQAMAAYSKAGKEVVKNKRDNYIEPVSRGKYEAKPKPKAEPINSVNKKTTGGSTTKPQSAETEKTKKDVIAKDKPGLNKSAVKSDSVTNDSFNKNEKIAEIKASTPSINKWLAKRREQVSQENGSDKNNIVSRETQNVKQKTQKSDKKIQENADQVPSSSTAGEKKYILQELMEDVDVSEIVIMSSDLVQIIKWGSSIERYSAKYVSYAAFEEDLKKYLANKKVKINWDSTYSKATTKEGDLFTVFNKTARDGSKKISVRVKKSKKVRYFSFNHLSKEGIQTLEMANQEAEAIQAGKSIIIFGEDRIDNLTVLNSIISKIPSKAVGAMIACDSDLDYKGHNVEVFTLEQSQMDELDGLVEALVASGSKWMVFDQISKANYNHVLSAVKAGSTWATVTCIQTADIKEIPEYIGLATTESRKFANEINSESANCIMIKVGKDETGKVMVEKIIQK